MDPQGTHGGRVGVVSLVLLAPVYGLMMMSNTTVAATLLTARSQRVSMEQQATVVGLGTLIHNLGFVAGGMLGGILAVGLTLPTIYRLMGSAMLMCALWLAALLGRAPAA
jgi:predicted MFS family arabinose efflux permease